MKYPVNEQEFVAKWLSALEEPDYADQILVSEIVHAINRAYRAGLEAGRKETGEND